MQLFLKVFLLFAAFSMPQVVYADPKIEDIRKRVDFPNYNYDMTIKAAEDLSVQVMTRVDMNKPVGERLQFLSATDDTVVDDVMSSLETEGDEGLGDIWCDQLADRVPSQYSIVNSTDAITVFEFEPLAETKEEEKIFPHLRGRITVDKRTGQVIELKLSNTSPFKPSAIAKVRNLQITYSCQRLPNGMMVLKTYSMSVSGSALLQSFEETEVVEFSNYHPSEEQQGR